MARVWKQNILSVLMLINIVLFVASIIIKNYIRDFFKDFKQVSTKVKIFVFLVLLFILIIEMKLYKSSFQHIDDVLIHVTEAELNKLNKLQKEEAIDRKIGEILDKYPDKEKSIEKILEVLDNKYKHIALQKYLSDSSVGADDKLNYLKNFWSSNIENKNNTLKKFFTKTYAKNTTSLEALNGLFANFLSVERIKRNYPYIMVLSYNFDEKLDIFKYCNIYQLVLDKDMAKKGIIAHMELTGSSELKDKFDKYVKGYEILKNVPDQIVKNFLNGDSESIEIHLMGADYLDLLKIFDIQKKASNTPKALEFKKEKVPTIATGNSSLTDALEERKPVGGKKLI